MLLNLIMLYITDIRTHFCTSNFNCIYCHPRSLNMLPKFGSLAWTYTRTPTVVLCRNRPLVLAQSRYVVSFLLDRQVTQS